MIDKNTIARLRALHDAAPKGWTAGTGYEQSERGNYIADEDGRIVAAEQDDTDCVLETQARDLMVEMRNALPELLDLAEKMPQSVTFGLDEVAAMCRNIGYDITCGRCASVFFTNMALEDHDPECKNRPPESISAVPTVEPTPVLLIQLDALLRDLEPNDNGEGACCDPNAVLEVVRGVRRLILDTRR